MWADRLALGLRPRPMWEAADLGVRMTQCNTGLLLRGYAPAAVVVLMLAASTWWWDPVAPAAVLFFLKPWLDRAALLVFARAAFGQPVTAREPWQTSCLLSFGGFLSALTLRRLSPWRSYTQAVRQLENQRGGAARRRSALLLRGQRGAAMLHQLVYAHVEVLFTGSLVALIYWMTPDNPDGPHLDLIQSLKSDQFGYTFAACQLAVALLLEPFFVASGFSMYLNRRVELEAWDVEQELRRAFAT